MKKVFNLNNEAYIIKTYSDNRITILLGRVMSIQTWFDQETRYQVEINSPGICYQNCAEEELFLTYKEAYLDLLDRVTRLAPKELKND